MRLEKSQVRYNAVADYPGRFFKIITTAKDLADLVVLDKMAAELSQTISVQLIKFAIKKLLTL